MGDDIPRASRNGAESEQIRMANAEARYWRQNYEVLVRVIAAKHPDPAYAWLDELVRTRFGELR